MSKIEYKELIAFHPGYYLKEMIEYEGMNQDELAKRLKTSGKNISDLINGKTNLSDEMALNLSIVFGTSVSLWLNLNKKYIEKKLEIDKRIQDDKECELVKKIDYKFWSDLGLVETTTRTIDKVKALQSYFKVASLEVLCRRDFLVQYRTTITHVEDVNVMNANAWVQTAINIGNQKQVKVFNKSLLIESLSEIRKMTLQNPEVFYPRLEHILAECGVALVLLPNLRNCGINGAVKWVNKDKVILAINNRRKYADIFWFSLFHELGHIVNGDVTKGSKYIDTTENENTEQEHAADLFASNSLLSSTSYCQFTKVGNFTLVAINQYAATQNVMPYIVIGRLQKDGYIPYTRYSSYKLRYKWAENA
jgi:HTH-type transcriptional regulator/antitoxin HigA